MMPLLSLSQQHGQCKVDCLDELLISPICTSTTPTYTSPDGNWLLGADPFSAYNTTCVPHSDMQTKLLGK